jgi:hypothetical protein
VKVRRRSETIYKDLLLEMMNIMNWLITPVFLIFLFDKTGTVSLMCNYRRVGEREKVLISVA